MKLSSQQGLIYLDSFLRFCASSILFPSLRRIKHYRRRREHMLNRRKNMRKYRSLFSKDRG